MRCLPYIKSELSTKKKVRLNVAFVWLFLNQFLSVSVVFSDFEFRFTFVLRLCPVTIFFYCLIIFDYNLNFEIFLFILWIFIISIVQIDNYIFQFIYPFYFVFRPIFKVRSFSFSFHKIGSNCCVRVFPKFSKSTISFPQNQFELNHINPNKKINNRDGEIRIVAPHNILDDISKSSQNALNMRQTLSSPPPQNRKDRGVKK